MAHLQASRRSEFTFNTRIRLEDLLFSLLPQLSSSHSQLPPSAVVIFWYLSSICWLTPSRRLHVMMEAERKCNTLLSWPNNKCLFLGHFEIKFYLVRSKAIWWVDFLPSGFSLGKGEGTHTHTHTQTQASLLTNHSIAHSHSNLCEVLTNPLSLTMVPSLD